MATRGSQPARVAHASPLEVRLRRLAARILPIRLRHSRPALAVLALVASTSAADIAGLVALLGDSGIVVWIAGGWGVDALVGRRTRRHDDLDLIVPRADVAGAQSALAGLGFRPLRTDVVPGALLPERTLLVDPRGRQVDLHPVDVDAWLDGIVARMLPGSDPRAAAFAQGSLAGRPVPCLSAALQLASRAGYDARSNDRHDVGLLRGLPAA